MYPNWQQMGANPQAQQMQYYGTPNAAYQQQMYQWYYQQQSQMPAQPPVPTSMPPLPEAAPPPPSEEKPPLPPEPPPAPPAEEEKKQELKPVTTEEQKKLSDLQSQAAQWQQTQQWPQQQWPQQQTGQQWPAADYQQYAQAPPPAGGEVKVQFDAIQREEVEFDQQYKQWKQQYDDWKKQNENHPNKEQFKQYEAQWQQYEQQMEDKKKDIQHRKQAIQSQIATQPVQTGIPPGQPGMVAGMPPTPVTGMPPNSTNQAYGMQMHQPPNQVTGMPPNQSSQQGMPPSNMGMPPHSHGVDPSAQGMMQHNRMEGPGTIRPNNPGMRMGGPGGPRQNNPQRMSGPGSNSQQVTGFPGQQNHRPMRMPGSSNEQGGPRFNQQQNQMNRMPGPRGQMGGPRPQLGQNDQYSQQSMYKGQGDSFSGEGGEEDMCLEDESEEMENFENPFRRPDIQEMMANEDEEYNEMAGEDMMYGGNNQYEDLHNMNVRGKQRGGFQNTLMRGGAQNARIRGGAQNMPMRGGAQNMPTRGGAQNMQMRGGAQNNQMRGRGQNQQMRGGTHNLQMGGDFQNMGNPRRMGGPRGQVPDQAKQFGGAPRMPHRGPISLMDIRFDKPPKPLLQQDQELESDNQKSDITSDGNKDKNINSKTENSKKEVEGPIQKEFALGSSEKTATSGLGQRKGIPGLGDSSDVKTEEKDEKKTVTKDSKSEKDSSEAVKKTDKDVKDKSQADQNKKDSEQKKDENNKDQSQKDQQSKGPDNEKSSRPSGPKHFVANQGQGPKQTGPNQEESQKQLGPKHFVANQAQGPRQMGPNHIQGQQQFAPNQGQGPRQFAPNQGRGQRHFAPNQVLGQNQFTPEMDQTNEGAMGQNQGPRFQGQNQRQFGARGFGQRGQRGQRPFGPRGFGNQGPRGQNGQNFRQMGPNQGMFQQEQYGEENLHQGEEPNYGQSDTPLEFKGRFNQNKMEMRGRGRGQNRGRGRGRGWQQNQQFQEEQQQQIQQPEETVYNEEEEQERMRREMEEEGEQWMAAWQDNQETKDKFDNRRDPWAGRRTPPLPHEDRYDRPPFDDPYRRDPYYDREDPYYGRRDPYYPDRRPFDYDPYGRPPHDYWYPDRYEAPPREPSPRLFVAPEVIDHGHKSAGLSDFSQDREPIEYKAPQVIDYGHGKSSDEAASNRDVRESSQEFGREQDYSSRDSFDYGQNYSRDRSSRDYSRDSYSNSEHSSSRDRDRDRDKDRSSKAVHEPKVETVNIDDLLLPPGRKHRPPQIVVILRGLPGSGKSYVGKLIKDKEVHHGGSAPRMLCLDDYFMVEVEKTEKDPESGKKVKKKVLEYEYEAEMESSYRKNMYKSFKKTIDDGFFPFIIVDAVNEKERHFEEFWSYAKSKGFQVYMAEMKADTSTCIKRNIHNRSQKDIEKIEKGWQETPKHYLRLDVRSLLQEVSIQEVEMETEDNPPEAPPTEKRKKEESDEEEDVKFGEYKKSKWEIEASGTQLDKLDGLIHHNKKIAPVHQSMEDFLQLPDDYDSRPLAPGEKRVRWADIEERKLQSRRRDIGFVVGQTQRDWERITDDSFAERQLNRTKYF